MAINTKNKDGDELSNKLWDYLNNKRGEDNSICIECGSPINPKIGKCRLCDD